jgi:hypothetical protein
LKDLKGIQEVSGHEGGREGGGEMEEDVIPLMVDMIKMVKRMRVMIVLWFGN